MGRVYGAQDNSDKSKVYLVSSKTRSKKNLTPSPPSLDPSFPLYHVRKKKNKLLD